MAQSDIDIIARQPTIGAEIKGLDLSGPLSTDEFNIVYQALLSYKVIYFRDQNINTDQHLALAKQFGELEVNPFRPQGEGRPALQIIKNDKDNRVLSTDVWHADLTFREKPTKFTILRCLEIPPQGGDTVWADMCAAYDGLSESMKNFVCGLEAIHDFKNFRVLYRGTEEKRQELHKMEDMFPNPTHPVIITHPETQQRVLFVNRQFTVRIKDMSDYESRKLLDLLYDQASVPEYQFRLKWRPGTVAIWDNRLCQHYAVNDYYPNLRHMERVAIEGDVIPYFNADAKPDPKYPSIRRVHAVEGMH